MTGALIECTGLGKRYRRYSRARPRRVKDVFFGGWRHLRPEETLWGLRNVSFRVQPGRMLGVIGRNGAGKSTLLRLVGGVGEPDEGVADVQGRIGALLDLELGFHPDLTGRENALVSGVMGGLTRREVLARMDAIAAFAEIEDFLDAPLRTYSTGMRMRLGFSIAAHADPDVLLIDEVLSVGDIGFQKKCMERITRYKEQGAAILLVSHNVSEVESLCDEVLWLEEGQVRALGETAVVLDEYKASISGMRTSGLRVPEVSTASTGQALKLHENRIGTLQTEIAAVRLRAPDGTTVRVLESGQPLQVYVDYLPHERIANPIFQVKIVNEGGLICWEGNTVAAGVTMPDLAGPGTVRLIIERQDLAEGAYFVEAGIYEPGWETVYDYHFRVYPLQVVSSRCGEGVLDLPSRWDLVERTPAGPMHDSAVGAGGR